MSVRKYLIDNDVVIKLSQYDLLDDLVSALDSKVGNIYLLSELRYVAYLDNKAKGTEFFGDRASFKRARQFYFSCQIAEITDIEVKKYILSLKRPSLDPGELILLGCMVEDDNSQMITGDKRAVIEIDKIVSKGEIIFKEARFIILETALNLLMAHLGFEYLSNKVRTCPHVDLAVTNCFGRFTPASEASAKAGLSSYVNSLISNCNNELLVVYQ